MIPPAPPGPFRPSVNGFGFAYTSLVAPIGRDVFGVSADVALSEHQVACAILFFSRLLLILLGRCSIPTSRRCRSWSMC